MVNTFKDLLFMIADYGFKFCQILYNIAITPISDFLQYGFPVDRNNTGIDYLAFSPWSDTFWSVDINPNGLTNALNGIFDFIGGQVYNDGLTVLGFLLLLGAVTLVLRAVFSILK